MKRPDYEAVIIVGTGMLMLTILILAFKYL